MNLFKQKLEIINDQTEKKYAERKKNNNYYNLYVSRTSNLYGILRQDYMRMRRRYVCSYFQQKQNTYVVGNYII